QIVLIFPVYTRYPQKKEKRALVKTMPGTHFFSDNLGTTLPIISWRRYLPTLVPVSTAVRMNTASNMMAKWYQYDIRPLRKETELNMYAIPTASETAPPGLPCI